METLCDLAKFARRAEAGSRAPWNNGEGAGNPVHSATQTTGAISSAEEKKIMKKMSFYS
jgi:hypothetical protein